MGARAPITAVALALVLVAPTAMGTPLDHRDAADQGAERLLEIQFDDGAFPWAVGDDQAFQNVQGVTAQGLLDAYRVTGDEAYLDAAGDNADWLVAYLEDNPDAYMSAPNAYFLAEYALTAQSLEHLDWAREAFDRAIEDDRWEDTPTALAELLLQARENQGLGNLGLWDVALLLRAAQDIGDTDAADELAAVLVEQAEDATIVDPFDASAENYEIGLAALLFGLAEADLADHRSVIADAGEALQAEQGEDGSVPGDLYGDTQTTAYAALGFVAVGEPAPAIAACDWLESEQTDDGAWLVGGAEYGETNSEAVQALATCTLPARNGAQAYGDAAVGLV